MRFAPDAVQQYRTIEAASVIDRRQALRQIGIGLGAGLVPGACSLGPRVCETPPAERAPATMRDAEARALLAHIETFVVVMLENRSFDHFMGGLRLDAHYPAAGLINGLSGEESNLDDQGRIVRVSRMPGDGRGNYIPAHDYRSVRETFNEGKNDRFVALNAGEYQDEVMSYLGRDQLPYFHALADRFTVFDHWFASYMGQTWPNRYYLHATTSHGRKTNLPMGLDAPIGIWERMAERCCSARNYAAGNVLWYSAAFPLRLLTGESAMVPGTIEDFFADARSGNLPNFALIDPDFKVNDAYPKRSLSLCEAFVASLVKAMAEGPQWNRSLLLVIFDEHGGYYDHVPPPSTADLRADFRQLGFRVPALAIGPTVRQGAVVSTPLEHVSVAATLRARFGIESLSERMDATADISACIDPARLGVSLPPARPLPPVELPGSFARPLGFESSQPEIEQALADRTIPAHLVDARSDTDRLTSWLRHAQELDAVRLRA
jgi:phospholipase C